MRLALALSLLTGTCAPSEVPETGARLSVLPAEAGPLDALNRRHARLRQRMRRRGYGEEVGLSRAFVLEDRGVAWPLDLEVGKCSTFIALGGGDVRDLELSLYDGEGEETASDTVEREGALLHVCPQGEPGVEHIPFHLELRALEGAGAVMVAHFRSQPGEGDGFDGLFEGVLAPRVPFADVEEHLANSRTALRARGFEPIVPPLLEHVSEGSVVRQRVQLEEGRCYVIIGRSGEGLIDIDLFLFDAAGVEVARDLGADAEPSIEHCPPTSARHIVELRTFEGAGAVGVMVLEGPGPDPDAEEEATEAVPETSRDPSVALGVLAAPLVALGFAAPVFVTRDAAIVPGEVRTHEIVIGPGCALVAGTGSDEAMDLDLYLGDANGREVDRDTAVQSTARVRACRDQATVMRVAVKAYGRDGTYALAVLRAPSGIDSLQALRLEEATAPYRARGYAERMRVSTTLEESGRIRRQLTLDAGSCIAVVVAGADGVRDVDLFLRDMSDELSASDTGPAPHATVSRCAEHRETLSLEIVMQEGAGRVEALVLQSEPRAPEEEED